MAPDTSATRAAAAIALPLPLTRFSLVLFALPSMAVGRWQSTQLSRCLGCHGST